MPDIYIHAGAFKTATTSFQLLMNKNKNNLLSENGLLYLNTGLRKNLGSLDEYSMAHHTLFHASRAAENGHHLKHQQFKKLIEEEIFEKKPDSVIISTELLTSANITLMKQFINLFPNKNIKIIYAYRRPDLYIDSMNNQLLKQKGDIKQKVACPFISDLKKWAHLVGEKRLIPIYMEKNSNKSFAIEVLEKITKKPIKTYLEPQKQNESITLKSMFFIKSLQSIINYSRLSSENRKLHRALLELQNKLIHQHQNSEKLITISLEEREKIIEEAIKELNYARKDLKHTNFKQYYQELNTFDLNIEPNINLGKKIHISNEDRESFYNCLSSPIVKRCLEKGYL
ncbi:hypothetical protein AAGT95_14665 [Salinicola lusitanus]|uniref:Sulfotransferase domain-containing protein n=1 Tax=Salinicola lusitanus TaxID=1949085 RepID=A0ABZ3CPK8_9GAMM